MFRRSSSTIMEPAELLGPVGLTRRRFVVNSSAEVVIEIAPHTLTKSKALSGAGVTSASLGAQRFDPAVQRTINHTAKHQV